MNGTEQKAHTTALATLDRRTSEFADAITEHLELEIEKLRQAIGEERTHRLKLADEQRAYVDGADRALKQCCQERWDVTANTHVRLWKEIADLRDRGFWSRLNWLLTGR